MSELKPLLDDDVSARAARLLRSADIDAPRALAKRQDRVLAALVAASSVESTSAKDRAPLRSFLRTGKFAGLAAVALVAGALATRISAETSPRLAATTATYETAEPRVAPSALPARPPTQVGTNVEDLPSAPASAAAGSRGRAAPRAPDIEDELAAVDAARAALAAGKAERALGRVEDCRRRFREPHFAEEVDAIEVQALAALGRSEARGKAERFLTAYPHSAYEQRVRSVLGEVSP